ncbi:hypothetical protein DL96DRAFT_1620687 [Flagelloscypha sp. PMI_526]|nr:hypothetical protein DL96DRAFT_1620687 [Flagelloscypha sp. PMI_526]
MEYQSKSVFLFESYIRTLNMVQQKKRRFFRPEIGTRDPHVYGCLISGTPGIGKTTLLQLYLILSLVLEASNSLFSSKAAGLSEVLENVGVEGLTVLVDLGQSLSTMECCSAREVWVIGVASPNAEPIDKFVKHLTPHMIVMDNPETPELVCYDDRLQCSRTEPSSLGWK